MCGWVGGQGGLKADPHRVGGAGQAHGGRPSGMIVWTVRFVVTSTFVVQKRGQSHGGSWHINQRVTHPPVAGLTGAGRMPQLPGCSAAA